MWKLYEIQIALSDKFYWNTAMLMLIHLRVVCGCFCAPVVSWVTARDHMPRKAIYCLAYYTRSLPIPGPLHKFRREVMMGWASVAIAVSHGLIVSIFLQWNWQVLLMDCLWDVRKQGIEDDTKIFSLNNWKDIIAVTLMKDMLGTDFEEITWNSVLDLVNLRCLLAIQM